MNRLLQQLDSNEAILLMYLADELSEADRSELEDMLGRDAALRAQLQALQAAQGALAAGMKELDRSQSLPVPPATGVRQISRLMSQWQMERLARRPRPVEEAKSLPYPWWTYPVAAAAAVLVAVGIWWGNFSINDVPGLGGSEQVALPGGPAPWQAGDRVRSPEWRERRWAMEELQRSLAPSPVEEAEQVLAVSENSAENPSFLSEELLRQ